MSIDLFSSSNESTEPNTPLDKPKEVQAPLPLGTNASYTQAYAMLNPEQKKAVDLIEGPVMVNAGPGTGKTQILANRIGKILLEQEIAPHNILCLTYTDSGAIAMRKRLVKFIGPTAHQVHIYTFHGFCNQVIQENLDVFGGYRQLEPITDLESVDVFRALLDNLPSDNKLKRFKLDKYDEAKRMKHLFDVMKKENHSTQDIHKAVELFLSNEKPNLIAKRKSTAKGITYLKGDFRQDKYDALVKKYAALLAASDLFEDFNALMKEKARYDFNDMILWVIREFGNDENLLSKYQERYQYFLVDEYQDTNGSQNTLLEMLISYWDAPNVFVVGDDDQAIFKFQGANLGNIISFKDKYDPAVIVLKQNYRSNQLILDKSKQLIANNTERLVTQIPDLSKDLIAAGKYKADLTTPQILSFDKISEEYAYLAQQLQALYQKSPDELNKTAVIFRWQRQVRDLVTVLEKLEVPLNIKRRVNILTLPLIKNLINILSYLSEELTRYGTGQHRLFEMLHYSYFGIDALDLGKLALHCQKKNAEDQLPRMREVIADTALLETLNLKNPEAILATSTLLDSWITGISTLTLQLSFEKIINEGGILKHIMTSDNKSWQLQTLSTFFDLIKRETAKDPKLNLKALLAMILKMEDHNIDLPINKTIYSEKGVHLITAHSAKGLEYKRVFVIGCTKDIWDKSNSAYGRYSYPNTINVDTKNNDQDERRLFYVAMTRAEKELIITYSEKNEAGKELGKSLFVDEIEDLTKEKDRINIAVPEETTVAFYYNLLLRIEKEVPLIEKDLIDKWLHGYRLSVTHLNKYLKCPLTFYFEAILRVPGARNASSGFGSAMHDTLHKFFNDIKDPAKQSLDILNNYYEQSLLAYRSHFTDEEFQDYMTHGKMALTALHKEKLSNWLEIPEYALEVPLTNAQYKGVPLKGVIDKVEIHKSHVNVVDYKTGTYKSARIQRPSPKNLIGGDYWRQIVFYKMLLDSDKKHNWLMSKGSISYIEPDRKSGQFTKKDLEVTPEDMQTLGAQITETYSKILNYEFNKTCEDTDCRWCNLVDNNYQLKPTDKEDNEHNYDEETAQEVV